MRMLFYLGRYLDLEALGEGIDCSFIALTCNYCASDLLWDGVEGAELWKVWALCIVGGREIPSVLGQAAGHSTGSPQEHYPGRSSCPRAWHLAQLRVSG